MSDVKLNLPRKILSFLNPLQRIKAAKLVFLMLVSSFMEIFSLGLLVIIMNFFLESGEKNNNSFIYGILDKFITDKDNSFLLVLTLFFTILFIKIIIFVYLSWCETNFIARLKQRLADIYFSNFLNRPVHQILKKNSSEHLRNFTTEIDHACLYVYSIIRLILEVILVSTLFIFLVFFDYLSAISTLIVLIAISSTYYLLVKNRIKGWGEKRLHSQKKKLQYVNESFSAIKYIKILSREKYFYYKFSGYLDILNICEVHCQNPY